MTSVQLRKRVHEIVDRADDRFLKMIVALMSEYEDDDYELTAAEMQEVYRRSKEMKSGKAKNLSLEETIRLAKKRMKK